MIWEILNDESYNDIYCKYGCCMSFDGYHGEEDDKTEMELMGLQDADDCWIEGLDREWSYDLHLHQHFHNLYTTIQASASSTSFMLGTSTQGLN